MSTIACPCGHAWSQHDDDEGCEVHDGSHAFCPCLRNSTGGLSFDGFTASEADRDAALALLAEAREILATASDADRHGGKRAALEWHDRRRAFNASLAKLAMGTPRLRHEQSGLRALTVRMAEGRAKYPAGCTVLSLLDEAGEFAHAVNKRESLERVRDELLDVAAVAMRLYASEIDTEWRADFGGLLEEPKP